MTALVTPLIAVLLELGTHLVELEARMEDEEIDLRGQVSILDI